MKINWKSVAIGLAFVVVYDEIALLKNAKTIRRQHARQNFLAETLDKNEVVMTEYDQIALKAIDEM